MVAGVLLEPPMGKKKTPSTHLPGQEQKPTSRKKRVELQAPLSWVAKIDEAARLYGVSRSDFIRMACNRLAAEKGIQ